MHIVKYITLFAWSLLLMTMLLTLVRAHPFVRRKKEKSLNTSEGVYILALLISGTWMMLKVMLTLDPAYDVIQKLHPDRFWQPFLQTASMVSVTGLLIWLLLVVTGRWLSVLVAGNRNPLIELDADHLGYALLRAGLLMGLTMMIVSFCGAIFELLVPSVELPLYR